MPNLYVLETGSRIEVEYERILVTLDDEVLLRLPLRAITQITLIGRIGVSTPALHKLLEKNIPLTLLSYNGRYLGQITPALSYNLPLRQQQFGRNDENDFTLSFSRELVAGKIHNQRIQAERWARTRPAITKKDLEKLEEFEQGTCSAPGFPSLLGIEGNAARVYFGIMRKLMEPEWGFKQRNRRPPRDPINAMLSFGYTLLTSAVSAALQVVGLDPYLGYFHTEGYGRPALALDLVEEFRVPVVDALVVAMVSLEQVKPEDFRRDENNGRVIMSHQLKREFVREFGQKLAKPIKTREIKRALTYQKLFEVQARKVASLVQGKIENYEPFRMR